MKRFVLLLALALLLSGCGIDLDLWKGQIQPGVDEVNEAIDGVRADLNANVTGDDGAIAQFDELAGQALSGVGEYRNFVEGIQAENIAEELGNENLFSLTPTYSAPITITIPYSYYPSSPQPARELGYKMEMVSANGWQSMSLIDMAVWFGQAVALPFSMLNALVFTADYIGPLGTLIGWAFMALGWVLFIYAIETVLLLVRNGLDIGKLLKDLLTIFR